MGGTSKEIQFLVLWKTMKHQLLVNLIEQEDASTQKLSVFLLSKTSSPLLLGSSDRLFPNSSAEFTLAKVTQDFRVAESSGWVVVHPALVLSVAPTQGITRPASGHSRPFPASPASLAAASQDPLRVPSYPPGLLSSSPPQLIPEELISSQGCNTLPALINLQPQDFTLSPNCLPDIINWIFPEHFKLTMLKTKFQLFLPKSAFPIIFLTSVNTNPSCQLLACRSQSHVGILSFFHTHIQSTGRSHWPFLLIYPYTCPPLLCS